MINRRYFLGKLKIMRHNSLYKMQYLKLNTRSITLLVLIIVFSSCKVKQGAFGMMDGNRVKVDGNLEYDFLKLRDESVRGVNPDVNAIAAKGGNSSTVMVWNYHDKND